MITATAPSRGASFTRKRTVRTASSIASAGLMAGFSLAGASSAAAATDADCTVGNTVSNGLEADVQTLLDADTAIICLSGTFVLTTPLTYDYDVTIHGLVDAVLDGGGVGRILSDTEFDSDDNLLTVENIRFTNGSDGDGGAIRAYEVHVYDSQFDNNDAFLGGAIAAYSVDIYDSLFFDNEAFVGGAVTAEDYVGVTRTTFSTNEGQGGGAIYSYGVAYIDSSTFEENEADFAGAVFADYFVDVQNSTFVGNTATDAGGALIAGAGSARQSTFLDNTAGNDGQSILVFDDDFELRGNIFAGSTASTHLYNDGGAFVDLGANLFTTAAEPDLTPVAPTAFGFTTLQLFNGATLASNGGPTQTVALHAGSPALSAVPASPDSMTVDQRGVARPAVSDAGAYEFANVAVLAATGSEPAGWLAGAAALLLAGAAALGLTRRTRRTL